jgi:hypothetical protein
MRGWFISLYGETVCYVVKSYTPVSIMDQWREYPLPATLEPEDYENTRTESVYNMGSGYYYPSAGRYQESITTQMIIGAGMGTGYKWAWDNGFTMTVSFNVGKSILCDSGRKSNTGGEENTWPNEMIPVSPNLRIHMPLFDFAFAFLIGYSF